MQAELRALQPQLVRTVAEVEKLMETIAREKKEVVEPKAAVVKVRAVFVPCHTLHRWCSVRPVILLPVILQCCACHACCASCRACIEYAVPHPL